MPRSTARGVRVSYSLDHMGGSAAKFHYIKIVSGSVLAQSIAFRVVSIYWQGDDPFSLKFWLQVTYPLLKAASFDTFCLVVP